MPKHDLTDQTDRLGILLEMPFDLIDEAVGCGPRHVGYRVKRTRLATLVRSAAIVGPATCLGQSREPSTSGRIRFLGESVVVGLNVLATQLRHLSSSMGADPDTLRDSLAGLVASLRATAQSCHGLQLRIVHHGCPVILTEFTGLSASPSAASLRVDLSLLQLDADPGSRFVFYAEAPGAFVDLAADLQYAMGATLLGGHRSDGGPDDGEIRLMVQLDRDLPPVSTVSGLVGLSDFATMNRAVGMLMNDGLLADAAFAEVQRRAVAAGVEPLQVAIRLLTH